MVAGVRGASVWAWLIKLALLACLNALGLQALFILAGLENWIAFGLVAVTVLALDFIYLKPGLLPAKYLAPGLILLAVFQIFVIVYTTYISFTNYGDQRNGTKDDAVAQIIRTSLERVPDSPQYALTIVERDDELGMLVASPDGAIRFGTNDDPLTSVEGVGLDALGRPEGIEGWKTLDLAQVIERQSDVFDLTVQATDDVSNGALKTSDGQTAFVYTPVLEWDEKADTFTDTETGLRYTDGGRGLFRAESGETLTPGWRVVVGFENYTKALTDPEIRDPLIRVTVWTFVFATLSVLMCFGAGLAMALVFNHPRLRGKKLYRSLLILPYAFPAFLSALVWAGLLNPEFGFINQVIFGGADIPWLSDPYLARFSVLMVNMWLGYPYMFLVCTGALQAIPEDSLEAASMDGAGGWRTLVSIKLPAILVATGPLLIATFAFNFNNFNLIFMLTRGWPRFTDTTYDVGATDLLITMVYKIAFGSGGGRDYGLASALSIVIFVIVAVVSIVSFRRTRALEELN